MGQFTWEAFFTVIALIVTVVGGLAAWVINRQRKRLDDLATRVGALETEVAVNEQADADLKSRVGRVEKKQNGVV